VIGPDAIIFPNLRGNGLFDALHRDEMYAVHYRDHDGQDMSLWERMLEEKGPERAAHWLLTPTLPNRFLALAPAGQAETLAAAAERAVRDELCRIGDAVWPWIEREASAIQCSGVTNWKRRWDAQIKAFPQIAWAVQPWLDRDTALAEFAGLPASAPGQAENGGSVVTPYQRLQEALALAEQWLPDEDRDHRYYTDAAKTRLNNPGALWAAHYALADAKLAARRNTRDFPAWRDPVPGASVKDSLSGKEECIGDEAFWEHLGALPGKLFAPTHRYGGMNLIKRLWCRSDKVPYLRQKLGLQDAQFRAALRFETVQEIACQNAAGIAGKDADGDDAPHNPYVAILAMDGDEMGKWVSGEKTPAFLAQLSDAARRYLEPILAKHGKAGLRRLLTPSYHVQFSEALANFSTWLAAPVVEAFRGQLIYAGGDDVLAMLPADQAIACSEALRAVFRGEPPADPGRFPLSVSLPGCVNEAAGFPLLVPGPQTDVSIGLAIGHCRAPLQSLVREAQNAEKTAKSDYGRGALAVTLYKRSGETIQWGCKWDAPSQTPSENRRVALRLMRQVTAWSAGAAPLLSGRFPYALAALLAPYRLAEGRAAIPQDILQDIMLREFEHVVKQQGAGLSSDDKGILNKLAADWLKQTAGRPDDFIKLFLVETFMNRQRGES
ncbi:MAG: type III-B CRISPR-associated protein Cas10/Cmr2, partial [Lentisphaerae bacterium]|nr:type III-B CRISPR-associated protein Cas10/Cmr2 [Lentisphaerota bacterium]